MKPSIFLVLTTAFALSLALPSAFAANLSMPKPVPSPTFPEHGRFNNETYYAVEDLAAFDTVKATIEDEDGNSYSFIQVKQLDDSYNVFIPRSVYEKLVSQGVELKNESVKILTDKEYILLSKQVQLNTFGRLSENDYIGGEGGRCAAGTIGGAITGGLAGGAVGGPAGAVAGAIGGALVGSAASCR